MEVEANVLSSFDLNSGNIPAFSFSSLSVSSEKTLELRKLTDDQMSENGGERGAGDAPAAAITRCTSSIAAMKPQKVYRGYRTRRMLADSAVVAEELWTWQALDFARLNHSIVSFFNVLKPETTASRWNLVKLNASKVGKGLSKDAKAQKLAFQHWIESIDPRHCDGRSLHIYYEEWCKASAGQPFFYCSWILEKPKRLILKSARDQSFVNSASSILDQKRGNYEYHVVDGKVLHTITEEPLDTNKGSPGSKWIFVLSTSKRLYSGEKKKGLFHHSSFLAGGATLAAGRLIADDGVLKKLDIGDGKEVDLKECPRSKLHQQCIKYLGPKERQHYEYQVVDGKIMHTLTGEPLDTIYGSPGSKWIFVMSTSKRLYSGEKTKGLFHHSSFLAGGATLAAGRLIADDGVLKCISAYSGHYKPTDDCLDTLSLLNENGVNLDEVEICKAKDDYDNNGENGQLTMEVNYMSNSDSIPCDLEDQLLPTDHQGGEETKKTEFKRTLLGGLQSTKADILRASLLQRIETKKFTNSYESGHPLSYRWSTGAGPRIGHIADYPVELRLQALRRPTAGLVSTSSNPENVENDNLEALNQP
ncbi:hypothetical protein CASFOL_027390 [Castilleja foliolosa]|uniref:IQ domain-containing protein IQM3-like n=1 Tax=Castilleja foliolosa TaxID=1961234 RepID=A0ABD3CG94_9LAMI